MIFTAALKATTIYSFVVVVGGDDIHHPCHTSYVYASGIHLVYIGHMQGDGSDLLNVCCHSSLPGRSLQIDEMLVLLLLFQKAWFRNNNDVWDRERWIATRTSNYIMSEQIMRQMGCMSMSVLL